MRNILRSVSGSRFKKTIAVITTLVITAVCLAAMISKSKAGMNSKTALFYLMATVNSPC